MSRICENGSAQVTVITQWYSPEPTIVPVLTAQQIKRLGHRVNVLTGIPNRPGGVVHPGYKAWRVQREERGGIELLRTPLYADHSVGVAKRMFNYLSWAVSASILGVGRLRRSDVNVVHCTPATTALPALIVKKLFRVPYILIIQDLWPDSVVASGFMSETAKSRTIMRFLTPVVSVLYRNAEAVAVISPGMVETLIERGIDRERLMLIYNSVDEHIYRPQTRDLTWRYDNNLADGDFVISYAGNQGAAQDLDPLIRAVGMLPVETRVRLVMAGNGVEHNELRSLARSVAPGRIQFIGQVAPSDVRRLQVASDLCVVSLKDSELFRITMPSKVQSLMAAGLPILGIVAGDAAALIKSAQAGVVAEPGNIQSIVAAILKGVSSGAEERDRWGMNGYIRYRELMSSEVRERKLKEIIQQVLR